MKYTGERPTIDQGSDGSLLRYNSILPFCQGKIVLDYGCGIGIGSQFLSTWTTVIGFDTCKEALEEAKMLNKNHRVNYIDSIEEDSSLTRNIEICCMVEVIEHIEKDELDKILRSLKYDLVGTTPNGNLFTYHPKTIEERQGFHVWHYTYDELKELLNRFYHDVQIFGAIWDPVFSNFTSLNFVAYNHKK